MPSLTSTAAGLLAVYLGVLISDLVRFGNTLFAQDIAAYGGFDVTAIAIGIPEQTGYFLGAGCFVVLIVKEFVLEQRSTKTALGCIVSAIVLSLSA